MSQRRCQSYRLRSFRSRFRDRRASSAADPPECHAPHSNDRAIRRQPDEPAFLRRHTAALVAYGCNVGQGLISPNTRELTMPSTLDEPKPEKRAMDKLSLKRQAWSSGRERGGHEGGEEGTLGGADPAGIAAGGERHQGGRHLPRARDQRGYILHLEEEVFGTGTERTA